MEYEINLVDACTCCTVVLLAVAYKYGLIFQDASSMEEIRRPGKVCFLIVFPSGPVGVELVCLKSADRSSTDRLLIAVTQHSPIAETVLTSLDMYRVVL